MRKDRQDIVERRGEAGKPGESRRKRSRRRKEETSG